MRKLGNYLNNNSRFLQKKVFSYFVLCLHVLHVLTSCYEHIVHKNSIPNFLLFPTKLQECSEILVRVHTCVICMLIYASNIPQRWVIKEWSVWCQNFLVTLCMIATFIHVSETNMCCECACSVPCTCRLLARSSRMSWRSWEKEPINTKSGSMNASPICWTW